MKENKQSNPFEPMEQIEDEYDPMEAMEEAYNDRPCFMDELEKDEFELIEQLEDEYGPCSFIRDYDLEYEMKCRRETNYFWLLLNSKLKNEGVVNMEKCTLCNWENVESNESLVDHLNRNGIMNIDLCDYHEKDLEAFCEED